MPAVEIEVRTFKWPRRPTFAAVTELLGEDEYGRWLGIRRGNRWWAVDGSRAGLFEHSFVKLVPTGTFWTACFNAKDPIVDVDIVQPVTWLDGALEEVDLELDVLRSASGVVQVRDRDEFMRMRTEQDMPGALAAKAEEVCKQMVGQLEQNLEPFQSVGGTWLSRLPAN